MLVGARTAAWSGGAKSYDVQDYVGWGTSDLVAMWDGIRNVGATSDHSQSASVWADLSSNGYVMTPTATPTWVDDAAVFNKDYIFQNNTIPSSFLSGTSNFAIECTLKDVDTTTSGGICSFSFGFYRFFWIWYSSGGSGHVSVSNDSKTNVLDLTAGRNISANRVGLSSYSVHQDCVVVASGEPGGNLYTNNAASVLGGYQSANGAYKLCCLRIYSRQLLDSERAANYAIDAARFGLT